MAEFATFVTAANPGGVDAWQRRRAFGAALPNRRASNLVVLEIDAGADAGLLAAFAGKLSTVQPTGFLQPAVVSAAEGVSTPDAITLYLEPTTAKLGPAWNVVCERVAGRFQTTPANPAFRANVIAYVVYHNVDAAAAKGALAAQIKVGKKGASAPTPDELWSRFVAGEAGALTVSAGTPIGRAATLPPGSKRVVGFGVRTAFGMIDPGLLYEDMVVATGAGAPAAADAFARGPLQSQRPLIDPARDSLAVGNDRLWPWSALLQYKTTNFLPYSAWRELGDAQKAIYLAQLLARARPSRAPAGTARFAYDVDDMANVFQLEAVVEFYANFPEPWDLASQPVTSGPTYRTVNFLELHGLDASVAGNVVTLDDALDMTRVMPGRDTIWLESETTRPHGQFRVMAVDRDNQKLTLDRAPTTNANTAWRMFHNPTLVMVDAFGSRVRGAKAVNVAANVLELQALSAMQLDMLEQVNTYEVVDLVDVAAGAEHAARLTARPTLDRAAARATLHLDRPLAAAASGSAWAIPSGVGGLQQPTVDLVSQEAAGVRGTPDTLDLTPRRTKKNPLGIASDEYGFDQYDGVMFMVAGGEIRGHFPWTSYTSRKVPSISNHSSIKGNALYRYGSSCSQKPYINVAFRVIDTDGFLWGEDAAPSVAGSAGRVRIDTDPPAVPIIVENANVNFIGPGAPRFSLVKLSGRQSDGRYAAPASALPSPPAPFWIFQHSGVRRAKYYFMPDLLDDTCAPDQLPGLKKRVPPLRTEDDQAGKNGIYIHKGERTKSVSEGCQVSPSFMSLRVAMMTYEAEANATYYAELATPPRFRTEVHWEEHEPASVKRLDDLRGRYNDLDDEIKRLKGTLKPTLDRIASRGITNAQLKKLAETMKKIEAFPHLAPDTGEGASKDNVLDAFADMLAGASTDEVAARVREEHDALAAEIQERAARMSAEYADIKKKLTAEAASFGWDDVIHGEYWVIRPDERFA